MALPAVEVCELVKRAQMGRVDRRVRAIDAARSAFIDGKSYKTLMAGLREERRFYEPETEPHRTLEHRATGQLRTAIDETMARARENVKRLKAKRKRR